MPMATIHKAGEGNLYHIHFLDSRTDPGFGQGGIDHPDHSLPGRPARPDQGLPGSPGHPSQGLPGNPNFPSNTLPGGPPPHIPAGVTLVLVRDAGGVWHYATLQPGSPPPIPAQPLPPTAAPKPA